MIPTETIAALEQCWDSISDLCRGLDEALWESPTDLPAWTVKDNLSHLIGIERMLEGLPATEHRAAALGHVQNPIGAMNEHEVDARRGRRGAEVLAEWVEITDLRRQRLHTADDAYFAEPAMTPTGPGTVADFLHIRVLDCWVHEQDMRRGVGRPGNLAGPAAELTVDRLLRTLPIVVGKRAATPEGAAVVVEIGGGVRRRTVCEVRDGRAVVVDDAVEPLCTIRLDVEDFVVLATGRRSADRITAAVEGDAAHARRILERCNMMI